MKVFWEKEEKNGLIDEESFEKDTIALKGVTGGGEVLV